MMNFPENLVLNSDISDLHEPVLLKEVLEYLRPEDGGIVVDATLGMGGHSQAILERYPKISCLIGMDRDGEALELAAQRLEPWRRKVALFHANFADMADMLEAEGIRQVDAVLVDLGISSYQLEQSGRGFSFRKDEPLDMRMDRFSSIMAADLVNQLPKEKLEELIFTYGEERWAAKIASAIEAARQKGPILTSRELAEIVERAIPRRFHPKRIHPATKTFQAVRIAVNREFENLKKALDEVPGILKPGGRFLVISFHSLEDRLVKQAFRNDPRLRVITKRPVKPAAAETAANPRARSAKLRVAERLAGAGAEAQT